MQTLSATVNLLISFTSRQRNFENNALISDFVFSFIYSFENKRLCLIDV